MAENAVTHFCKYDREQCVWQADSSGQGKPNLCGGYTV